MRSNQAKHPPRRSIFASRGGESAAAQEALQQTPPPGLGGRPVERSRKTNTILVGLVDHVLLPAGVWGGQARSHQHSRYRTLFLVSKRKVCGKKAEEREGFYPCGVNNRLVEPGGCAAKLSGAANGKRGNYWWLGAVFLTMWDKMGKHRQPAARQRLSAPGRVYDRSLRGNINTDYLYKSVVMIVYINRWLKRRP